MTICLKLPKFCVVVFIVTIFLLTGCQKSVPVEIISSAQIRQISDRDILAITERACKEMDEKSLIVPDNHPLSQRLNQLIHRLPRRIDDTQLNYKIYLNTELNAWSTPNGCIRINSHLIKSLNDNELQAVVAHEIGHIALAHSIVAFRRAPYIEVTERARDTVLMIRESLAQQQEIEADSYAFELLTKKGINPQGMLTMLIKLPVHSTTSRKSHPSNTERIAHIIRRINNNTL